MSNEDQELTTPQVRLKKNGDLIQRIDGAEVVVAKYAQATGALEFQSKEFATKLYNQVTARIGTVNKGLNPSGNVIRTITVKGMAAPDLKSAPKRPKMGPLGDATPELVEWFFEYNLPEAIVRYGVYTDAKGNPRRANVERKYETMVDNRQLDATDIQQVGDGPKSFSKAPVAIVKERERFKNQIIARRATHLTFTPDEVVGGFETDDDELAPVGQGEDEA